MAQVRSNWTESGFLMSKPLVGLVMMGVRLRRQAR